MNPHSVPAIILKRDALGTIERDADCTTVVRNWHAAAVWARPLARRLAQREARALERLAGEDGFAQLLEIRYDGIARSWLDGNPMHEAHIDPRPYFRDALRKLRRLHSHRIAHNDLAKEANWICMPMQRAGIIDFQIALCFSRRTALFRMLAHEDLRHLLKHKRHYAPQLLTARQRAILARPAWTARIWRAAFKPVYLFVTRRLLGWEERNSAVERSI